MCKLNGLSPLLLGLASAFATLLLAPAAASAPAAETAAPPEFNPGTVGICRLYNLSGYLALDAEGRILPLRPYCQQQRNWAWHEPKEFWQRFREVATVEAVNYSQTLDQQAIDAYAQSICPFLEAGNTLEQLTQIQANRPFPADFERALTVAAVDTYCQQHRDPKGR